MHTRHITRQYVPVVAGLETEKVCGLLRGTEIEKCVPVNMAPKKLEPND